MSDSWYSAPSPDKRRGSPRQVRRGAGLALVFASVLATGAATGAWGDGASSPSGSTDSTYSTLPASAEFDGDRGDAAAQAREGRRAGGHAAEAEELVSRSGDRWSAAYTASEFEGLARTLDGEYVGVGVSVQRERGVEGGPFITVARVVPGSPAHRAGVREGDRLRTVDGEDVSGSPVTEVVARLRGTAGAERSRTSARPGSTVALGLERDGRQRTEKLERARLTADAVTVHPMSGGLTRIEVSSFSKGAARQIREAVADRAPEGGGILLDLRGNPGGLVSEAVEAASVFLDGGLVATYDDHGTQRALHAESGGSAVVPASAKSGKPAHPLVVLVDGGTMSAAELLTGALQDRGRAVVVGSRTFGKGSVQMPQKLSDGSVAEMTVGQYATPSGRKLDGRGIAPDLSVDASRDSLERARTVLSGLHTRP